MEANMYERDRLNLGNDDKDRLNRDKPRMVTGSFTDHEAAERAYNMVIERGYDQNEIHVIMSDETRKRHFGKDTKDKGIGNKAVEGLGVGGAVGGTVGATLMAIAAAASTLTIPGLGLVIAGPLAGALAGGAIGAAAGGIVGTLIGLGIPEERAREYEKDLKEGAVVLAVEPRNETDAEYFEREWQAIGQHVHR